MHDDEVVGEGTCAFAVCFMQCKSAALLQPSVQGTLRRKSDFGPSGTRSTGATEIREYIRRFKYERDCLGAAKPSLPPSCCPQSADWPRREYSRAIILINQIGTTGSILIPRKFGTRVWISTAQHIARTQEKTVAQMTSRWDIS